MSMDQSDIRKKTKNSLISAGVITFLLLLTMAIPAVMITISLQSPDEVILLDEAPLNKKQGLPQKTDPDGKLYHARNLDFGLFMGYVQIIINKILYMIKAIFRTAFC